MESVKLDKLLDVAIENEKCALKFYEKLSKIFPEPLELKEFWIGMMKDEASHRAMLVKIKRKLTLEQLQTTVPVDVWEAVLYFNNRVCKDLVLSVRNLNDAYELTHEIEYSEINSVFKFLVLDVISKYDKEELVVSNITSHQNKILDFGKMFGDLDMRLSILPRFDLLTSV